MSDHFIKNCRHCNKVLNQCRCPATDKKQEWGECDKCKEIIDKSPNGKYLKR